MDATKNGMQSEEATGQARIQTPGTRRRETQRPLKRLHGFLVRNLSYVKKGFTASLLHSCFEVGAKSVRDKVLLERRTIQAHFGFCGLQARLCPCVGRACTLSRPSIINRDYVEQIRAVRLTINGRLIDWSVRTPDKQGVTRTGGRQNFC